MSSGGYRQPSNPAPVSGPGKLARRTDGGPAQKLMVPNGLDYGDRAGLLDQERTAPMSQADNTPSVHATPPQGQPMQQPGNAPQMVTPFGAPTERPNEPVTHGVDIGAGGGPEAMPMPPQAMPQKGSGALANMLRSLSTTATSGSLADLYQAALTRGL